MRKAIKALEERAHIVSNPARSPVSPARYTLILHPRNLERRNDGLEQGEIRRLKDAYDLVEEMAVDPRGRRFRYQLGKNRVKGKLFTTPEQIEGKMTPTRLAALRDARLRDKKQGTRGTGRADTLLLREG